MSLGERARVKVSPDFAYGERGVPDIIPENETMSFEIELVNFDEAERLAAEKAEKERKARIKAAKEAKAKGKKR